MEQRLLTLQGSSGYTKKIRYDVSPPLVEKKLEKQGLILFLHDLTGGPSMMHPLIQQLAETPQQGYPLMDSYTFVNLALSPLEGSISYNDPSSEDLSSEVVSKICDEVVGRPTEMIGIGVGLAGHLCLKWMRTMPETMQKFVSIDWAPHVAESRDPINAMRTTLHHLGPDPSRRILMLHCPLPEEAEAALDASDFPPRQFSHQACGTGGGGSSSILQEVPEVTALLIARWMFPWKP